MTDIQADDRPPFDRWGNRIWWFGPYAIRVDISGAEPMFCLKDCLGANGLKWKGAKALVRLPEQKGMGTFHTPGGTQSLVTISEEGFYILSMRGRKPISDDFRAALAGIAKQLRKTGHATVAPPVDPPASTPSLYDAMLQQHAVQGQIIHQLAAIDRKATEAAINAAAAATRSAEVAARVDRIEARSAEATRRLLALSPPSVPAPSRTDRHNIVEHVRGYSMTQGVYYEVAFSKLYREVRYRLGVDVYARKRNDPKKYETLMDVIEEAGILDRVYAIAREVFVWQPRIPE